MPEVRVARLFATRERGFNMHLPLLVICACLIAITVSQQQAPPSPQQIAKIQAKMKQECEKCRMCKTKYRVHPCESPLCKGTVHNFGLCKLCMWYPNCYMCNTMCLLLPMLTQIPAG